MRLTILAAGMGIICVFRHKCIDDTSGAAKAAIEASLEFCWHRPIADNRSSQIKPRQPSAAPLEEVAARKRFSAYLQVPRATILSHLVAFLFQYERRCRRSKVFLEACLQHRLRASAVLSPGPLSPMQHGGHHP